ncbi:hypothetical protein BHE74_00035844 [Ensete ventricosum]|nr:hypothetical protein BHE74_00035844 [Ensete ventricosum]
MGKQMGSSDAAGVGGEEGSRNSDDGCMGSSNVKRLRMVRLRQREEEAEEGNGEGLTIFSRMLARAGQQKWQGSTGGRQHHDRTPKGAI